MGDADYAMVLIQAPVWDEDAVTALADRLQAQVEKMGAALDV